MAKAREKLSPVPKPRKARPAAAEAGVCAPTPPAPDLSAIAETQVVLLAELAFLAGNPLDHPDAQIEDLRASLRQWGQVETLVVNRRTTPWTVVGGNGRLRALLAEGRTHAAVSFVDLSEASANALAIVLNRSREGAEWNKVHVAEMLKDVDTGNDPELDAMLAELAEDTGAVEVGDGDAGEARGPVRIACPHCWEEFPLAGAERK